MRDGKTHAASVAIQYAEEVLSGKIPACQQIQKSCRRFLADIDSEQWVYSAHKVDRAVSFIQTFPYLEGDLAAARKTLTLQPWQVWIVANLFGLVDDIGIRKHREAFIEIPRKNGKSTFAAGIALYMLVADYEPRAQVYIGANSIDQADYCFQPCREMALRSRFFAAHYGVSVSKQKLELRDGSFLKRMIGKPGDGGNPHCAILDEAHENDSPEQRLTMKTGMGARKQPLLITITTAGFNVAGPCRDLQAYAEQILDNEITNDRLFSAIYTIDKDDNWQDFEVWKKANPNAGVSFSFETLRDFYQTALDKPSEKSKLLTKHLNVWQSSSDAWVNMKDWDDNSDALPFNEVVDQGYRAWIGCDLSRLMDTTAIVVVVEVPQLDSGPKLMAYPFIFLPEMALQRTSKNAVAYAEWSEKQFLKLTSDDETDFGALEEKLVELSTQFNVQQIGFDAWQAAMMSQRMAERNLPVITYPQNYQMMHPPMSKFEKMLALGELKVANNPMLRWMAGNVVAKRHDELMRPAKPPRKEHAKIDGFVALLMALGLATKEEAAPLDIWLEVLG